jgi:2-polyprenyl-6-methoxyphenol hydroxylase-like FAD-dependent oxidoreductase
MKVLVSGGGIAGSAAALFLARRGYDVRIIDRVSSFARRGYAITLKSFGLKLMAELGLADDVARLPLNLHELRLYRADAHLLQVLSHDTTEKITHGQILMYRSDLHGLLQRAAQDAGISTRFGLRVVSVRDDDRGVRVELSDGSAEDVDWLVVAEGVRSTTRKLLWEDEGERPFDVVYAAGTIHLDHGLDVRAVHGYLGEGQNVAFMPVGAHDLLVQCYWRGAKTARSHDVFCAFAPEVRRFFDAMDEGDVFSDSIAMVHPPSLHRSHVVLVGDAGIAQRSCPAWAHRSAC